MGVFRVREIIDGLHTIWTAAAALDGVTVRKSWEVGPDEQELLFVAGDGGSAAGSEDIATSTIEWPGLSGTSRTEDGSIDCAVSVWTGDQDAVDATITRAFDIVGACEDTLRMNPSLWSEIALQAKIVETRLRIIQAGQGLRVIVLFIVAFQTSV
jgi:hypothetical protein